MPKRKYQDVEKLLEQNPGMTIAEAGKKLGYKQELQNKGQGRVGLRNRQVDQNRAKAESMQRGEATRYKPPKVSGFDQHHKRMIMLYRPLYEGLSDADALELSKYAAAQGMPLGDVEDNYELLSTGRGGQHDQLHRYMEQQGMRPSDMPDFSKADLDNRKKAFNVLYKDFIQADIDKKTSLLLKGGGVRFKGSQMFGIDPISPAVASGVEAVRKNVLGSIVGAATAIEPEAVKSALQGNYRQAAKQTILGAGVGALVQQGVKLATPVVSKVATKVLPKVALSTVGAVAKLAPPIAAGYAGYEMIGAIVEGATGKNLQETGVAAEEKKEQLREEGYSDYELRRRARTGYRRP